MHQQLTSKKTLNLRNDPKVINSTGDQRAYYWASDATRLTRHPRNEDYSTSGITKCRSRNEAKFNHMCQRLYKVWEKILTEE